MTRPQLLESFKGIFSVKLVRISLSHLKLIYITSAGPQHLSTCFLPIDAQLLILSFPRRKEGS